MRVSFGFGIGSDLAAEIGAIALERAAAAPRCRVRADGCRRAVKERPRYPPPGPSRSRRPTHAPPTGPCASSMRSDQRPAGCRSACGTTIRYGRWLKPREVGMSCHLNTMSPGHVGLDRPAVHADRVVEARASEHVGLGQLIFPEHAPRLAHADLWRDLEDVGFLEAGRRFTQELEEVDDLAPAFHLGPGQLLRIGAVDRRCRPGLASWVTLARHSIGFFCGRMIGVLRGKMRPLRSASSIQRPKWFQASPARSGSTPLTRNMVDG